MIDRAFANIEITADPIAAEFPQLAKDQVTAGIAKTAPAVAGFADLGPLNDVLTQGRQAGGRRRRSRQEVAAQQQRRSQAAARSRR